MHNFLHIFTLFLFISCSFAQTVDTPTPTMVPTPKIVVPRTKPFLLYPITNGDTPVDYSKAAPPFPDKGKNWDFGGGVTVQAKINPSGTIASVNPYSFGCNLAWYDNRAWLLNPDRIEKAKEAGIRYWRFPGGDSSNDYHWDGNYKNHPKDHQGNDSALMNTPGTVSTDDFIEFCRQTNSEAVITVNYGAARYDSVAAAADMAARWVKYFNIDKGFKVRYWEIGNENYGPWEEGTLMQDKPQLTGDDYGADFNTIAAAMRQVDPDIYLGAVIYQFDGGDEWTGHHWWVKKLLPVVKDQADFLVMPEYFLWPFNGSTNQYVPPTEGKIWGLIDEAQSDRFSVNQMVDKYSPQEKNLPVAISEFNTLNATSPPGIHLIGGLYTAAILGEFIKAGDTSACFWDWKNSFDPKLKGDFGMLSTGDPAVPDGTPRPSYYGFALYDRAFGNKMVEAQTSDPAVRVYASRFTNGELGIILVNENDQNRTMLFDWGDFQAKGQFTAWVLTGGDLNGPRVTWNSVEGPSGGGGPFPISNIDPYRGTFKPDKPFSLNIKAHSATGIIFY